MQRVNLPIGTSDFAEIRREGWYYVDKTGLIRDLLNTRKAKVTLITRPRRFGKTLGMNMLANFFDIQKDSKATICRFLFSTGKEYSYVNEKIRLCNSITT